MNKNSISQENNNFQKGDICVSEHNIFILESINGYVIRHQGICGLTSGYVLGPGVFAGTIKRLATDEEKNIILTNLNKI